ncbi:2710_t:CDS:2 [Gigaspora rosea]|nr:2710_t:CDS:2 [Gigaspora rosea]
MKPTLLSSVKDKCREFVSSFSHEDYSEFLEKLTHNGSWKECEEKILCVINEILSIMKDVWNNPALNFKVAGTLNEGTYQSTVIVPFILAVLKNLPFGLPSFISTSERESIASADRKGDSQMGRRPDVMFTVKYLDVFFEIMYVECSRLVCIQQKKVDDDIKLLRECNDGMYYTRKTLNPDKDQFGIVGIQIAGDTLHLNVLIRDKVNVHRYYNIESAKIPVQESDENVVTKFVETLLLLRNIIITNLSLLYHGSVLNTQPTIESLRELNSRLVLQIDELRKKFTEVESENIKLKQSFEEYAVLMIRFEELEKKNKADTANLTAENIKLKDRVTKLEQIQSHNDNKKHIAKLDDDIEKIKQVSTLVPEEQYSANINPSCEMNSGGNLKQIDSRYGNTSASDITDNTSNSDEPDGAFSNISENVSDTASNPDKKKLQSQGTAQNTSDIQNEVNPVIDQVQNTEVKIPYNKRVEQDLRRNLSLFIKDNNNKVSEDRVKNIKRINKIDDQSARTLVYNEIKALLPDVSDVNLRQRTFRAKKIYMLLIGIGIEKVQVIMCSASTISNLTDNQIQNIINCFPKNSNVDDSSVIIPTESSHTSNSEDMISKNKSLPETKVSASSNTIRDHVHFCNKILEQYPNLYKDGNGENVDYYGIADDTLCPLSKLDHDDDEDIEGRYANHRVSNLYEIGSYYIKCEKRGVEIETRNYINDNMNTQTKSNKILTPEYLEWNNKFTGLPSVLTDNIRSKLYKRYKKKTGLDPWIKSETSKFLQIEKDADNHILQDSLPETQVKVEQY